MDVYSIETYEKEKDYYQRKYNELYGISYINI